MGTIISSFRLEIKARRLSGLVWEAREMSGSGSGLDPSSEQSE
jgi:hypothetical protein